MITFDDVTWEDTLETHWPQIPGHQYRTLIIGGLGSVKTNGLLNLINHSKKLKGRSIWSKFSIVN